MLRVKVERRFIVRFFFVFFVTVYAFFVTVYVTVHAFLVTIHAFLS